MGQKARTRIRKRRKKIAETWDFLATKSLIAGDASKLCSDVRITLKMLNISYSSKNRDRYLAAMHRAVGAKSCAPQPLKFWGTKSGRAASYIGKLHENLMQQISEVTGVPDELLGTPDLSTIEARVMASREEQWRKMQSDVVDSWRSALTCYGTSTLRFKDGQLSPVDINEQNSTPDAPADISHGYLYRTKGDQ